MRNIFIFIGMAGVGKTTICKKVASYFNSSFIDIDHAFIDQYQISIVDFIEKKSSKEFNQIEAKMVENSLKNYSFISPGGSFIYSSDIIENISKDVVFIYLKDTLPNILKRIKNIECRGIIDLGVKTIEEIFSEREILYDKYADFTFDLTNSSFDECSKNIIRTIELLESGIQTNST